MCPSCGFAGEENLFKGGCPSCGYSGDEAGFKSGCPACGYSAPPRNTKSRAVLSKGKSSTQALPFWVYIFAAAAFTAILAALFLFFL